MCVLPWLRTGVGLRGWELRRSDSLECYSLWSCGQVVYWSGWLEPVHWEGSVELGVETAGLRGDTEC